MIWQLLIIGIVLAGNIFFGLVTLRNNPRSATHRLLACLSLVICLWTVANFLSLTSADEAVTLFWIRMVMVITSPLGPLVYLFLASFPAIKSTVSQREITATAVATGVVAIISSSPLAFKGVILSNGVHPLAGPGVAIFGIFSLYFLIRGFVVIYQKYRQSRSLTRLQIKYLILAFSLTFGFLFITNFVLVLFNVTQLVSIGPVFSLILLGLLTYSIVKHRLLDIRFVLARTVSYSLLLLIMATLYVVSLFAIGHWLMPSEVTTWQIVSSVGLALMAMYSYQPLKRLLEQRVDRVFFGGVYYTPEEIMQTVSQILATTIDLEELTDKVFNELSETMQLSAVGLLMKSKHFYQNDFNFSNEEIESIFDNRTFLTVADDLDGGKIKELMISHNLAVLVKLTAKDKLIGVLAAGHKKSGDYIGNYDLRVLEIIGPQLAIAIQNSQRYEEIKHFNAKLKIEIKEATISLKKANKKLKALDALKDDFVSVASHELRTPMTAIKSYLWMALDGRGGKLSDKQKYYIGRSYESTERLIKLVNNMLNISRIESGRMSLTFGTVDMIKLASEVAEEVKPRAIESGLTVKVEGTELPMAVADGDKIREVLINLVGNSLKFTPRNGKITIHFEAKGEEIITAVTDSGTGMTAEDMKHLFQKFGLMAGSYQVNHSSAAGSGLGLYISAQIIHLHGGKIWAESAGIGQGSTFYFSLVKASKKRLAEYQKKREHQSEVGIIATKI